MSIMKTVVLAYSGGLDTSVCVLPLKERCDYDRVITVVADRSALRKYAKHYMQSTSMELNGDMNDTSLVTHKKSRIQVYTEGFVDGLPNLHEFQPLR